MRESLWDAKSMGLVSNEKERELTSALQTHCRSPHATYRWFGHNVQVRSPSVSHSHISEAAGSSSCAITYYLAKNPECQRKLQAELDEALGPLDPGEDAATSFETVKKLPYLDAVINEGLRCHTTSGIGLPRIVPDGVPMTVAGQTFPPGTVLSVPSYTIHRDPGVWGDDVEEFRPERWFEKARQDDMQRTFNPFSYGPRYDSGEA
jgi:cytochrome P450